MSLPPETMMDLMAYADGELDGSERARVEELLRSSEEARRVVAAMGALGEVVRDGAELAPESARVADGIVDGVMAALAADARGAKVVPLGGARARGRTFAAIAVGVVALAAGYALYLRPSPQAPAVVVDDHSFGAPKPGPAVTVPSAAAPAAAVADSDQGVDLEEAESAHGKVDVFFTPSPAGAGAVASVVVWIDDRHGGH